MKFILGKKLEMSQFFDAENKEIPVTLIEAGPCYVTQLKTKEKDKYESVQIGFEQIKDKKVYPVKSREAGISPKEKLDKKIKKSQKNKPYRYLREFRGSIDVSQHKEGDKIDVSVFGEGDKVKISGFSKGKGFAGVVKRWGFHGRSPSHGTKHEERTGGSVGASHPSRVVKGRKMPGRMGFERVTVKNLKIVKIDKDNNLIAVRGAIPGRRGTLLEIRG